MLMKSAGGEGCGSLTVQRDAPELTDAVAALAPGAHAFLRSAWFAAAGGSDVRALAVLRASGLPLAALPLARRRLGPLTIKEVPGCYWPFRSLPLAKDITEAEVAWVLRQREVRSHLGGVWRMGPVQADDPTVRRLIAAAPRCGWTIIERRLGTVYEIDVANLTATARWPRSSTLARTRNLERRLAATGALDFTYATGADWTSRDRDAVAAIEANSWVVQSSGGGDTKFLDPSRRRVWEKMAGDPVLANMLFCSILSVGGVPAAFSFGLQTATLRYQIANGYDQRFAQYSPGKIILLRDFERAAAAGIERISWGAGDAGYKTEIGAVAGPEILDLLFVRSQLLVPALRRLWTGSFSKS